MAPKCPAPAKASGKKPKRHKKVMTLQQKVELLDMLKSQKCFAAVARHYSVNESTVRYIQKKEVEIRKAVNMSCLGSAKMVSTVRDKNIVRMELALAVWIKDCRMKNLPISHTIICEKARQLYQQFLTGGDTEGKDVQEPDFLGFNKEEEEDELEAGSSSAPQGFHASKGWLHRFTKRFQLRNVPLDGEVALADTETFKKIISNNGYRPEQDLAELTKSASEEEDMAGSGKKEEDEGLSFDILCNIMRTLKEVKEKLMARDPYMERAIKFSNGLDGLFRPYTNLLASMKKQTQQLPITSYFSVVKEEPPMPLTNPEVQVVDEAPPEEGKRRPQR
ncbi:tigger transposable element-derived protein 1-like [Macrobrachium nipponense]|uniref:tigger transposable element-derived protein 1-like n=1 Tax=Macrobrachium nipponense TaxID=159736 RepID=UPI0030C8465D